MFPPLGAGRSPTDEFFREKIMRDTVYIIVPTSIEIVNPLNITSLIHRLFMFFILNSCCAIFFSALPNSLLYGKQFSIFDRDFNSANFIIYGL